jgi:hypothetical protein
MTRFGVIPCARKRWSNHLSLVDAKYSRENPATRNHGRKNAS